MALYDESLFNNNLVSNGTGNGTEATLKNCFRLVILGAPKVGKTCIINWFLGKQYRDSYIPTIEDFHRKIYKIRNESYRLDILDTSGNDPFPAMKKLNIMIGDLFVLVFSLDDIDSYFQVKQLCELIIKLKKNKQDSKNSNNNLNIPILILGNKLDYLLENKIAARCVDLNETQQFASQYKCLYSEVSCKNRMGLDSAFERFFTQATLPVEMIPSKHRRVSLNLDLTKPQFTKQSIQNQNNSSNYSPGGPNSAATEGRGSFKLGGRGNSFKRNNRSQGANANNSLTIANTSGNSNSYSNLSNAASFNSRGGAGAGGGGGDHNGGETTSTITFASNTLNVEREGSFKMSAKKSFRKMTFRRQLTEAYGTVWLNARRPSIRAELKLLQVKTNGKDFFNQNHNHNHSSNGNESRLQVFMNGFRKLFMCHNTATDASRSYVNMRT